MYQFTKDCEIGIETIDTEHRYLFHLINDANELLKDDANGVVSAKLVISKLKDYADYHFSNEEEYMSSIADPELSRQKIEHNKFREYISDANVKLKADEENSKMILTDLLQYLSKWLFQHILSSDIMIGQFVAKTKEDPFSFSEKYHTGIAIIDEEHNQLFNIIRETNETIQEKFLHDKYDRILNILDHLKEYTKTHFADEEAYMQKIGYDGLEAQQMVHAMFIEKLDTIDLDSIDDNQEQYLNELIVFLLDWLSTHILKMDKKIPKK